MIRAPLGRRSLLASHALGTAALRAAHAQPQPAAPLLDFDFAGQARLPDGLHLRRATPAATTDAQGRIALAPADAARFVGADGRPLGLLIEGPAPNPIVQPNDLTHAAWFKSPQLRVTADAATTAPDGTAGACRIALGARRSHGLYAEAGRAPTDRYGTASLYVRATAGRRGKWSVRIQDSASERARVATFDIDDRWQRVSVSLFWEYRDTGTKRVFPAWIEDNAGADHLREAYVWGVQYETAVATSSLVLPAMGAAGRAADELRLDPAPFEWTEGTLQLGLPAGGMRDAVLLDCAKGGTSGLRLAYTASGWIVGRLGRLAIAGYGDASGDRVVELTWSRRGVTVRSGASVEALVVRAGTLGDPNSIDCGGPVRLMMANDGSRAVNRPLASLTLTPAAGAIVAGTLPRFAPAPYRLTFSDEFDDPDVRRINENATGGRPGAPAWRSRYRHPREDIINQEKQIYVDVAYAGTSGRPLGVQPFSIERSVLRIRADRPDPVRVAPFIRGQLYTSGCITSELTHWQTYGYFEMRAKLPAGKGFWPAFWLLPKAQRWPPEIDVFECSGVRRMSVRPAYQWRRPDNNERDGFGEWSDDLIDIADGFHIYGCEWTREAIAFFVDGTRIARWPNNGVHEDMYLLANLGLGSHDQNWIPDPDSTTPFPGFYEIDYIRAYGRGA